MIWALGLCPSSQAGKATDAQWDFSDLGGTQMMSRAVSPRKPSELRGYHFDVPVRQKLNVGVQFRETALDEGEKVVSQHAAKYSFGVRVIIAHLLGRQSRSEIVSGFPQ